MSVIDELKEKIKIGGEISREEALMLYEEPLEKLCEAADDIRQHFCGDGFDIDRKSTRLNSSHQQ